MAKTRRIKTNKSPLTAFRNSRTFIVMPGDKVAVRGVRGRTRVKRVVDAEGKRVKSVRVIENVPQVLAKPVGDRKPIGIYVGRVYTGQPRSKPYPYRSKKRGAPEVPVATGLMAKVAKAVKRVVVKDDGARVG